MAAVGAATRSAIGAKIACNLDGIFIIFVNFCKRSAFSVFAAKRCFSCFCLLANYILQKKKKFVYVRFLL